LNVALVVLAFVFQYVPRSLVSFLNGLEFTVDRLLHVRHTDFIGGYWEFFLPGIALALCAWVPLRLFSSASFTGGIRRFAAGIAAVILPPAWLCATYIRTYRWSPFEGIQLCELMIALGCVILYLYGRWPIPRLGSVLILLLHYAFWFWQFRFFFVTLIRGWGGAVAVVPVVGLSSSLAWMLYLANVKRESPRRTSDIQNQTINYSPKPL